MTNARRGPVIRISTATCLALSFGIGAWPAVTACSHASAPVAAVTAGVPASAPGAGDGPSRQGDVAVRFLADPAAADIKVAETEEFAPASPRYMPLPSFPAGALRAGAGSSIVAIRLHLDEGGFVTATSDSPRLASSDGPHQEEFRKEVEVVVRRWSFSPARIDSVAPDPDPSGPRPLISTRYVPTFLDFAFQFSVVDGRGVVSLGASTSAPASKPPR